MAAGFRNGGQLVALSGGFRVVALATGTNAAALFADHALDQHIASRTKSHRLQRLDRKNIRGHSRLHVAGTAAIELAVANGSAPWRFRPHGAGCDER